MNNNQQNNSKYNKLAVTGFILSLISIVGIGLAGLIGLVLGIVVPFDENVN